MKTPRSFGAILALCLPGFVAVVPAPQRTAVEPVRAAPSPTRSMEVRHREGAQYLLSTSLPVVVDVQTTLDVARASSAPGDFLRDARAALEQRYGARVVEEAAAPGYTLWWDGERWIIICVVSSNLAVDFGSRGTVEVRLRDWAVLP